MEWRPIETAPTDGSHVLLWVPALPQCITARYDGGGWEDTAYGDWWIDDPSHWMPLPPGPE